MTDVIVSKSKSNLIIDNSNESVNLKNVQSKNREERNEAYMC